MTDYHLAQINIGRIVAPLDSPQLSGFVSRLEEVNAMADRAPGFVWRLQTEDGDATALRPYDDDWILVNMSVWENVEALHDYVYRSAHVEVMRDRRQYFEKMTEAFMALWWIPAGHRPSVAEAKERLEHLRRHGPTAHGFTFRQPFPSPASRSGQPDAPLPDECPAG